IVRANHETAKWGVGQPGVTAVGTNEDGDYGLLLFYTEGSISGTHTKRRYIVFRTDGVLEIYPEATVTANGLTADYGSSTPVLNNADFIYDPVNDDFVVVHEYASTSSGNERAEVARIPSGAIWNPTAQSWSWQPASNRIYTYPKNHNCGLLRNVWGQFPGLDGAGNPTNTGKVFFTRGVLDPDIWVSLSAYDIYSRPITRTGP